MSEPQPEEKQLGGLPREVEQRELLIEKSTVSAEGEPKKEVPVGNFINLKRILKENGIING